MKLYPVNIVILTALFSTSCATNSGREVSCNFSSGAQYSEHDREKSFSENLFNDLFTGLFNIAIQGTHRAVSPETYDSCKKAKKDINTCIDSDGNIKENCKLTQ